MSRYAPFLLPLLLLYGYLVAAVLVPFALSRAAGHRFGSVLLIPIAAAVVLAGTLVVVAPQESWSLVPLVLRGGLVAGGIYGLEPIWTVPIALGAALAAVVTAHYAVVVLPSAVTWAWDRFVKRSNPRVVADAVRALSLAGVSAFVVGGTVYTASLAAPAEGGLMRIVHTFALDGSPTSIAMVDDGIGYMAYGEGSIVRFELDASSTTLDTEEVATGLSFPRGLAVAGDRLFVIDLGVLPCDEPFPQCWYAEPARELEMLRQTAGAVRSYPIGEDGRLGAPETLIDDLPVVSTEHAPNDIEVGADGMLYLTVGNVDRLPLRPDLLDDLDRPRRELLGTVVRFSPDGSDLSVFTRGIRNIYELATDPDGNLYGVDNDGPAIRGWRAEQLIELDEGVDWGFPAFGSFDAAVSPEATPIWNLHLSGSAGLAWVDHLDGRSGLLIGSLGSIDFVGLSRDADGPYVTDETAASNAVGGLQGFVSSIETIGDGRVLAAVFAPFSGYRNALIVLSPTP